MRRTILYRPGGSIPTLPSTASTTSPSLNLWLGISGPFVRSDGGSDGEADATCALPSSSTIETLAALRGSPESSEIFDIGGSPVLLFGAFGMTQELRTWKS